MEERIYSEDDGQWYYRTRGNQAVGPFANQQLAEQALQKQIRSWAGPMPIATSWSRRLSPAKIFRRSAPRHS